LIHHAEQFDNGAVFKRLGFLADTRLHDKKLAVDARLCQLDPALRAKKLVTAWRPWVPEAWKAAAS
jgi:hypothetical protein